MAASTPRPDLARRIEDCLADETCDPRAHFDEPQHVVDQVDAPYQARLDLLQRWRRLAGPDDPQVTAALEALESGPALGFDQPEGAPPGWGYGAGGSGRGDEE